MSGKWVVQDSMGERQWEACHHAQKVPIIDVRGGA